MKKKFKILAMYLFMIAGILNVYAQEYFEENGLYGISYKGENLTNAKYHDLKLLEADWLLGFNINGLWGIFDLKSKKEITAAKYDYISKNLTGCEYRFVHVKKGEFFTYIDATSGKEIAPLQYESLEFFCDGDKFAKVRREGKETLLTTNGVELFPPKYDHIGSFYEGLAIVKANDKSGYISEENFKEVIPLQFDDAFVFNCGIALVVDYTKKKAAFINKAGKFVTPYIYDNAHSCTEGRAPVLKDGKWGYIDVQGNQVIPFIYDDVYNFKDGKADVEKDGRSFIIDINGNEIKSN